MSHLAQYTCKHPLCYLQDCCDCCSLGLHLRREGHQCEAHHYLSFHCKHAFMSCCMGEENTGGGQDQWRSPVREKPALTSSPPPQKGRLSATLVQGERSWFHRICRWHWYTARFITRLFISWHVRFDIKSAQKMEALKKNESVMVGTFYLPQSRIPFRLFYCQESSNSLRLKTRVWRPLIARHHSLTSPDALQCLTKLLTTAIWE